MTTEQGNQDRHLEGSTAAMGVDPGETIRLLDRILSLAGIYPDDHNRFVGEVENLQQVIRMQPGGDLVIDVGHGVMAVQTYLVAKDEAGIARIQDICNSLGIIRIDLSHALTPQELHLFALQLLKCKHRTTESRGFHQFDFQHLPGTIRVKQREFGRRVNHRPINPVAAEVFDRAVEEAMAPLQQSGSGIRRSELCREMVEQIIAQVIERLESEGREAGRSEEDELRELDQVLQLGVEALQHAMESLAEADLDALDLQQLIKSTELALAISEDQESVQVMMDVLRQAGQEREDRERAEETEEDDSLYKLDLEQLARQVEECASLAAGPFDLTATGNVDRLALLCQFLMTRVSPRARTGLDQALAQHFTRRLSREEVVLLTKVYRTITADGDRPLIDQVLSPLLKALRNCRNLSPAAFLYSLGKKAKPRELALLWPHLVNELLLGIKGDDGKATAALTRLAASLSQKEMGQELMRLERLQAFQQNLFSNRIFMPLRREFQPICAALLASTKSRQIGGLILKGLKGGPRDWVGAEALDYLEAHDPALRTFLTQQLLSGRGGGDTGTIRTMAASIISKGLQNLPETRRAEPATVAAIRALGRLGAGVAKVLLREILSSRRWLIFPVWPGPSRQAARQALQDLRKGPGRGV